MTTPTPKTTTKRFAILFLLALAFLGLACAAPLPRQDDAPPPDEDKPKKPVTEEVKIGEETFHLELAYTFDQRAKGLMGRKKIAKDGGMIFAYSNAMTRSYWMGHCAVDIDIMFLSGRGRIVAMHEMKAESPQSPGESDADYRDRCASYPSKRAAQYAIELRAGRLKELKLKVGDEIDIDRKRIVEMVRERKYIPPKKKDDGGDGGNRS